MKRPKQFYYITHRKNLKSILENGIFARAQLKAGIFSFFKKNKFESIHNEDIIEIRKNKKFREQSLWNYANLYFEVRNPMLYSVIRKHKEENIVVIQVDPKIIEIENAGITDGNAASSDTEFFEDIDNGLQKITKDQFEKDYWNNSDDSKRKIMAELLVPEKIPKECIVAIYTANDKISKEIKKEFIGPINVIPSPRMFFLPDYQKKISKNITLVKGDMFFSDMQTFTISVNTVGVMGKGLASRSKYQFPDVYVHYQDLCRNKTLKMGTPVLYKRNENFEMTLMENSNATITENGHRWFLLFPTKNHWKESSPIDGIKKGLQWLVDNYKNKKIESIALPALGCGLGKLHWKDVGPLMCQHLDKMDIQSYVYLPNEYQIQEEHLSSEFLLKTT